MKRAFAKSSIALAVALSFGSAFADEVAAPAEPVAAPAPQYSSGYAQVALISETDSQTKISGDVMFGAEIVVRGEVSANASLIQKTTDNVSANLQDSPNNATLQQGAAESVQGNVGINLAAGAGNLQGNAAAIASSDEIEVFGSAATFSEQTTMTNFSFNLQNSSNNAVMDAALANANGNIGVNIAAGAGNVQGNQLSMLDAAGTRVLRAATSIEQISSGNQNSNTAGSSEWTSVNSTNVATIMGGAAAYASGNIGLNVASGAGNAQSNALAVAVSNAVVR